MVNMPFPGTTPHREGVIRKYEEGGSIAFRGQCFQVNLHDFAVLPPLAGILEPR
jgi:hypothetical protein